ncbi:sialate O-acetylesterase [Pseudozobellia thermophila]|uniref:Sialate O-acetylesterase n=1 Tax=Pseudozobellia thermophila TaxID=192903 RepID=A0A1M6FY68_9FLAO|nr:sialate O-acetylesterase [Pseudozobellia thermophila]SHJ02627.1 sialate O-acetylesterase [Pseudozobellia thermophila]
MKVKYCFFSLLFLFSFQIATAEITLPNVLSEGMVLQRNQSVKLWGWADTGEEITIVTGWDDKHYQIKTPITAKWEVEVSTPEAGGPYTISFKGRDNEIVLGDVLIGEVWVCSGQSNMQWSASTSTGIVNGEEEVKNANYPNIRFFSVPRRTAEYPQENVPGSWEVCTPETMKDFSAVAYFFGRRLHEQLNIPIGLIDNAWGGSPAEVWATKSVFDQNPDLKEDALGLKETPWSPVAPSSLYNGLVHGLTPFKIAGVIWYQGESNVSRHARYKKLFAEMVGSWRNAWGYDFPFYYVQIAPYKYKNPEEGVYLRNAQREALKVIPRSGMVVVSDIATVDNIHPPNKQDVGLRLANLALKKAYNSYDGEVNGPLFKAHKVVGKKIEVVFDHAEGLMAKGKKLTHFEVAGADGKYYPAKAVIKNDKVIVSSKEVPLPVNVRFAWDNVAEPNLFNGAGLPASAFTSE